MKKYGLSVFLTSMLVLTAMFSGSYAAAAPQKPANDFALAQISEVYIAQTAKGLYTRLNEDAIIQEINALPKLVKAAAPSKEKATVTLLTVNPADNFKKHTLGFCLNELRYDKTAYKLSKPQYDRLIKLIKKEASASAEPRAMWLAWMNPDRVTRIDANDGGTVSFRRHFRQFTPQVKGVIEALRTINVKSDSFKKFDADKMPALLVDDKGFFYRLTFDSGTVYELVIKGGKLYLTSSDMAYGCEYTLSDANLTAKALRGDLNEIAALPTTDDEPEEIISEVPMTGKPVIYLYPEKTRDISVKLKFKGELCTTIPEYNGGWNVTAHPDGTLINKADGMAYEYLFWDGNPDFKGWDMSEGFVVKGGEIGGFLAEKLPELGLVPHEYNEFIAYWTPILSKNTYNLISFSTAQYEEVAPLHITPAPDTLLRVHMLYKAIDKPVAVREQALPKAPGRRGFTAVEWGATRVE